MLIGTLSTAVFYLILFGDSLVGGLYLDHLCETEGGIHIYQTVELNRPGFAGYRFVAIFFQQVNLLKTQPVQIRVARYQIIRLN